MNKDTIRLRRVIYLLGLISLFWLINARLEASTVRFRIVALNPSKVKTQTVPVKIYLPVEVKPKDILDLGPLDLEFDAQKSLFYVYKEGLTLKPSQTRVFEVEVNDVWVIPDSELNNVKSKVNFLLEAFAGSPYDEEMKNLAQRADALIKEISQSQNDESISRSQHIGIYRTNKKSLAKLKEELADMEKLLEPKGGPLTPEMLAKSRFKTTSPTKTATWIVIFSVIIFICLLSLVFFLTWYRQSKITHKVISEAKKASFGGEEGE
jgi:hypothetical protein